MHCLLLITVATVGWRGAGRVLCDRLFYSLTFDEDHHCESEDASQSEGARPSKVEDRSTSIRSWLKFLTDCAGGVVVRWRDLE